VICKEDVGGRERVTTDEKRVARDQAVQIRRLSSGTFGFRALTSAGPTVCNSLLEYLCSPVVMHDQIRHVM